MFLRAAELLAGPWRSTLVAATMLNQSKTAHQAEIDAAAELIDFWRYNVEFMLRIYAEQPVSSAGTWNRLEYRPLEGFVFAVSPFNFTAIGGNLSGSPALMGNTVVWKPASTAALSAHYTLQILREAGLPDGVINIVYGSARRSATPRSRAPSSPGSTSPARPRSSSRCGDGRRHDRELPQLPAHRRRDGRQGLHRRPPADVDEVATAIVRGSFEYQGQKCSAASRVYAPKSMWPELRERLEPRSPSSAWATSRTSPTSWAPSSTAAPSRRRRGDRRGARVGQGRDRRRRRLRRQRGLLRRADRDPDRGSGLPMSEELFGPIVTTYVYDDKRWSDTLDLVDSTAPTGSRAPSSPTTASPSGTHGSSATRPATSTSTTSRPAPSSGSNRSAAPARPARTTRRARCGT